MNPYRKMNLWDLFTFMPVSGVPVGAYQAAKDAGVNIYFRVGFVAAGLAIGILYAWFIRVSISRLAQVLSGSQETQALRSERALKAIHLLLHALTVAWVIVSILSGQRLAKTLIEWLRL